MTYEITMTYFWIRISPSFCCKTYLCKMWYISANQISAFKKLFTQANHFARSRVQKPRNYLIFENLFLHACERWFLTPFLHCLKLYKLYLNTRFQFTVFLFLKPLDVEWSPSIHFRLSKASCLVWLMKQDKVIVLYNKVTSWVCSVP